MVYNFIEESNEKQPPPKCERNRCNCFHSNSNDSSDDELDIFGGVFGDSISSGSFGGYVSDILKSLIPCVSVSERNLLADMARIVEANKNLKQKDDLRKMVHTEGRPLELLDASIKDFVTLHEVVRTIHVGLLCVQRNPKDRPSMSATVLMLGSEGALPPPLKPGFYSERDLIELEPGHSSKACSANEVTISLVEPR